MEACLELFETDAVVGIQDMGAAGLTSSSFEMAGRAGSGVEIDLSKVPVRETGMTPYEIMLSESQERMLLVARRDRVAEVLRIFHKWELDAVEIGRVTDSGRVVLFFEGRIVADLPAAPLSDRAPVYDRPRAAPAPAPAGRWRDEPEPGNYGECLRKLLASPNIAEKSWIWTQYDHMVQTNTVERPGGDAALARVKGTTKAIAMKSDVNPFFCALDPYRGGAIAVAEAARSIAATGAMPVAVTDCLNFGNPERPEVMGQFEAAVRGISDACRALETPVVSGNVSFYNETDGRAIPPTPTIGMVGLLEDVERRVRMPFRAAGDVVALLGTTRDELGGSEFLRAVRGRDEGPCPEVDLEAERKLVHLLVALSKHRKLASAHDLSDGGLAVALAECAMKSGLGAAIALECVRPPSSSANPPAARSSASSRRTRRPYAPRPSRAACRLPSSARSKATVWRPPLGAESFWTSPSPRSVTSGPPPSPELWNPPTCFEATDSVALSAGEPRLLDGLHSLHLAVRG